MESKIDPTKKKQGVVKAVLSGDTVVFQGPKGKDGLPLEKTLRLNGITAPKLGDLERSDEPLAFESREYLRKRLLGKEVFFYIEHKFNDKEFGRVIVDEKDVANGLLCEGFAKLNEEVKNKPYHFDQYKDAQSQAVSKNKGVWDPLAFKMTRQVVKIDNPKKVLDQYKGQTLHGIVEEFRGGQFNVYVTELESIIKVGWSSIFIPIPNFKESQEVKAFIDPHFLHKDVEVVLTGYDEKYNYFIGTLKTSTEPNYDLAYDLIKNGHAKLNQNASIELDPVQFKRYKSAQTDAQKAKLRIWTDFEEKTAPSGSSTLHAENEFVGKVVEVHSGDCISVETPKGEILRLNLSNIRAPAAGNPKKGDSPKPWAFEAKEFTRVNTIGKKVTVQVEFTKNIKIKLEEEKEEAKSLTFATIILPGDKNLSALLVDNGLATVNIPRADEDFTQHLKALKDAEDSAKTRKVGLHSSNNPIKSEKFLDYSAPKMSSKARQFFEFVRVESRVTGVIDAVLSGSLFKIRLEKQNCLVLFSLAGCRTLQADKNIPQYEHFAKEAVKFSKENLLQRDVELDFVGVSPKGVFQGALYLNKKNFAQPLLESGLAYAEALAKAEQKFSAEYKQYEKVAQDKKAGIWGANISVGSKAGARSSSFKPINEVKNVYISEAFDPEEFYVQFADNAKTLGNIENDLKGFKGDAKLEPPIKKGTPCVAKFNDGLWYRARIEKVGASKHAVMFTDYGNTEEVNADDIRKLPSNLLSVEPQAKKCALAHVRKAASGTDTYEDSADKIRELIFDRKMIAQFVYEDGEKKYCMLFEKQAGSIKDSVNYKLLKAGLVKLDESMPLSNEQAEAMREAEEAAKNDKKGGWASNDFAEDYDEEY